MSREDLALAVCGALLAVLVAVVIYVGLGR